MESSNAIHSTETVAPGMLSAATREELDPAALDGCVYAFQLIDMKVLDRFPERHIEEHEIEYSAMAEAVPTVCLFGVDVDGHSVLLRVHGYRPYLYLELPWLRPKMDRQQIKKRVINELKRVIGRQLDVNVIQMALETAHKLGGYHPPARGDSGIASFYFVRLEFPNMFLYQRAARALKTSFGARISEDRVSHTIKFCDAVRRKTGQACDPCGWVGVRSVDLCHETVSWCDVELEAAVDGVWALTKVNRLAPLMVASYDIECTSPSGDFPDPDRESDQLVVIGTTCRRVGTLPTRNGAPSISGTQRLAHVLGVCANVRGVDCRMFPSEQALLEDWSTAMAQQIRIDCLLGYNVIGFDNRYCARRADRAGAQDFFALSKLRGEYTKLQTRMLSSSAMGDNEVHHLPMGGRFTLDMFQWTKNRFSNLKSLALDFVSRHFLGDNAEDGKIPLPYSAITDAWAASGTAVQRAHVVEYCVQDCDLPLRLAEKLFVIPEVTEMSRVCQTPLVDVLTRGQQIKVFSQLILAAHRMGFIVTDMPTQVVSEGKYVGATVLEPTPGYYNTVPVVTSDFASLYPSIMRSKNLCFCTWVPPGTQLPDHVVTEEFQFADGRKATFVQKQTHEGVLPRILKALGEARKATRTHMKKIDKSDPMHGLLDGRQLAYKISANSVYGFTGANKGMYPLKLIAEVTTCVGRQMIGRTKEIMETEFNAQVIYGDTDSVMCIFPQVTENRTERELLHEAFEIGQRACAMATADFNDFNELECEKASFPYMLLAKKKYCARVFEAPDSEPKLDAKGLAVVRRDTCDFVARVMKHTLNALMLDRSMAQARQVVGDAVMQLVENRVPIEELTLSKRLSGNYKNDRQPHLAVVARMESRRKGSAPRSGDRVPFVLIEHSDPKAKVFEKAEDPAFVVANGLKIDRLHYLTNNLISPVAELFCCFDDCPKRMFDGAIHELTRQRGRQQTLGFCTPVVFDFNVSAQGMMPKKTQAKKRQISLTAIDGSWCVNRTKGESKKKKQLMLC
jgi:DNA polymerase delta subunit 1